ncbi:MAG: linearmycin resistance ATP-binding protein LnrL [Promethearchaeota archaeon]
METNVEIRIVDLAKSFNGTKAVDGIDLDVLRGEIFGLLGPNGAGKTTTVSMISGLLKPDRGTVLVGGVDVRKDRAAAQARMGLVPQDLSVIDYLTARENVRLFGVVNGLSAKDAARRGDELLERLGLGDRANDKVRTYSGGMKRRLNLVLGLLHEPELLLLDEPTVGLDPQSRRAVWDLIKELGESGKTVLLTTHYIDEAEELCARVGIIDHGKFIALGTPQELKATLPATEEIEFKFPAGTLPPEGAFDGLDFVVDVQVVPEKNGVRLHTRGGIVNFGALASRLKGVPIDDLKFRQFDLEDLFIHLTGRAIRAET